MGQRKDGKPEDTQTPAPDPGKPAPAPENPAGEPGGKPAPEGGDKGEVKFSPEQQAYIDRLVGQARKEGRDKATKDADDARKLADEAAETKRLEDEKKWEQLANDRKAKLEAAEAQVKTMTEQNEKYMSAIKAKLDTERKGLPDHITALLDRLDPVDQLEWLAANGDAAKKPSGTQVPGTPTRQRKPSEPPEPGKDRQERIGVRL